MTKQIKYTKKIKLPMYNCVVHFIVTNELDKIVDGIFKKYKLVNELGNDTAEGIVISPDDISDYYLVIDLKYLSHNTLSHEMYHCVVRITEDRGISDEETQAWLSGHITEIVYRYLDGKNIKIKHG